MRVDDSLSFLRLPADLRMYQQVTHQVEVSPGEPAQPQSIISQETVRDPSANRRS